MCSVKRIKAATMFPLISEILSQGQCAKITVTGNSMFPFLRDGIDSVELTKGSFQQLSRGDIVMIRRTSGEYIMHRIIRKEINFFFMVGDAQQWVEGPLYPEQVVAIVTAIWRKDKRIDCSNRWWRCLTNLWLTILPYRYFILKLHRGIRKLVPN